jgi:hypothetical protein
MAAISDIEAAGRRPVRRAVRRFNLRLPVDGFADLPQKPAGSEHKTVTRNPKRLA